MRSYWILLALMSALFLALFGIVEALDVPFLSDPGPWLSGSGRWGAAAIGVGLLIADIFLPVPASLIMVANGALFGIVGGTLLSLAGGLAASTVAAVDRGTSYHSGYGGSPDSSDDTVIFMALSPVRPGRSIV